MVSALFQGLLGWLALLWPPRLPPARLPTRTKHAHFYKRKEGPRRRADQRQGKDFKAVGENSDDFLRKGRTAIVAFCKLSWPRWGTSCHIFPALSC